MNTLIQHSIPPSAMHMMGDLVIPDERILKALHNSRLVENLRDFEINVLTSLITVEKPFSTIFKQSFPHLKCSRFNFKRPQASHYFGNTHNM